MAQGDFDAVSFGSSIEDGKLDASTDSVLCLIYQFATDNVPSSLSGVLELPLEVVQFAAGKLNPLFGNFGCALVST